MKATALAGLSENGLLGSLLGSHETNRTGQTDSKASFSFPGLHLED